MELHEVFDASTQQLEEQLRVVRQALPHAQGSEHDRLALLRDTIQQELDERGKSSNLLHQLLPIIQDANPHTFASNAPALLSAVANAPPALQEELRQLVAAGERIAAMRQQQQPTALQQPTLPCAQPAAAAAAAAAQFAGTATPTASSTTAQVPVPASLAAQPTLGAAKALSEPPQSDTQSVQTHVATPAALNATQSQSTRVAATQPPDALHPTQGPEYAAHAAQEPAHAAQEPAHAAQEPAAERSAVLEPTQEAQLAEQASAASQEPHAPRPNHTQASEPTQATGHATQEAASEPHAPRPPPMSVQEAAMLAYKEEQRKLHKARKMLQAMNTKPPHTHTPSQHQPQPTSTATTRTTSNTTTQPGALKASTASTNSNTTQQLAAEAKSKQKGLDQQAASTAVAANVAEHVGVVGRVGVSPDTQGAGLGPSMTSVNIDLTGTESVPAEPRTAAAIQQGPQIAAHSQSQPQPETQCHAQSHSHLQSQSTTQSRASSRPQSAVQPSVPCEPPVLAQDLHQAPNQHSPGAPPQQGDEPRGSEGAQGQGLQGLGPRQLQAGGPFGTEGACNQGLQGGGDDNSSDAASYDYRSESDNEGGDGSNGQRQARAGSSHTAQGQDEPISSNAHSASKPLQLGTDRWTDWDIDVEGMVGVGAGGAGGAGGGVSAWGREASEDPLQADIRTRNHWPRATGYAPPAQLSRSNTHTNTPGTNNTTTMTHMNSVNNTAGQSPQRRRTQAAVAAAAASTGGGDGGDGGPLSPASSDHAGSADQPAAGAGSSVCSSPTQSPTRATHSHTQCDTQSSTQVQRGEAQTASALGHGEDVSIAGVSYPRQGLVTALLKPGAHNNNITDTDTSNTRSKQQPQQDGDVSETGVATVATAAVSGEGGVSGGVGGGKGLGRRPSGKPATPPPPSVPQPPCMVYAQFFNAFHEVFAAWHTPPLPLDISAQATKPPLVRSNGTNASFVTGTEIVDKMQGLSIRLSAWLNALQVASTSAKKTQWGRTDTSTSTAPCTAAPGTPTRYWAVADDTLHPEVRRAIEMALGGVEGWAPDPLDQITEVGKPDAHPDDTTDIPTSATNSNTTDNTTTNNNTSTTTDSVSGLSNNRGATAGVFTQPKSPLAGRCNLWNIMWTWSLKVRAPVSDLLAWQRVNHFPEAKQLTRKDLLNKHMVRYQVMHGGNIRLGPLFSCLPTTFTLPKDLTAFTHAFGKAAHGVEPSVTQPKGLNLWIVKPVGLSRGRGISLIRSVRDLHESHTGTGTPEEPLVVQRYVTNPLLVQGYKFDLRLFVLVTSFNPLEAWICREGFARFATKPFSLETDQVNDRMVHLTNSSVQKAATVAGNLPAFLANAQPFGGSKTSLTRLKVLLAAQGVPWEPVWSRVTDAITACLFAAQDAIPSHPPAFEVFGADVLIDTRGCVWVLEINSSPSLALDTPLDRVIKPRMLRDAIAIVDPLPFDRQTLLEVVNTRNDARTRKQRPSQPATTTTTTTAATTNPVSTGYSSSVTGASPAEERQLMCNDLEQVLGGRVPRRYGELPACMQQATATPTTAASSTTTGTATHKFGCASNTSGVETCGDSDAYLRDDSNWFECMAPSPLLTRLSKLKRSQ